MPFVGKTVLGNADGSWKSRVDGTRVAGGEGDSSIIALVIGESEHFPSNPERVGLPENVFMGAIFQLGVSSRVARICDGYRDPDTGSGEVDSATTNVGIGVEVIDPEALFGQGSALLIRVTLGVDDHSTVVSPIEDKGAATIRIAYEITTCSCIDVARYLNKVEVVI